MARSTLLSLPHSAYVIFVMIFFCMVMLNVIVMLTIKPSIIYLFVFNLFLLVLNALVFYLYKRKNPPTVKPVNEIYATYCVSKENTNLPKGSNEHPLNSISLMVNNIINSLGKSSEISHLAKLQGLIDHELAIGNRIFFESKLQYYLSTTNENNFGSVYLIHLGLNNSYETKIKHIRRLKACIEELRFIVAPYEDTLIARFSEVEIVMLVARVQGKEMEKLADRMSALLIQSNCFHDFLEQDLLHIGFTEYRFGHTSNQLFSDLDIALKTAFLHGQNAVYGYNSDKHTPNSNSLMWWKSELSSALENNLFILSFQPVFSFFDREIIQHEAVLELRSSDNQYFDHASIFHMALKSDMLADIEQHVLIKTARLCSLDTGYYSRCSVNVSATTLLDTKWQPWLDRAILIGKIDAKAIAIEISEQQLLPHYELLKPILFKLYKLGFSIIVDQVGLALDFGDYVNELPLESVKLHPSVVRNIDNYLEQQLFLKGIITHFANHGVRVLAPFVEKESEWVYLNKLGVAAGQGKYFSHKLSREIM